MHECAVFLAGYMIYEPLDPQTEPPKVLPSPCQSLKWHTGDSFDMAMILCSVLIGNGYDAYVVHGYAPKYITLHDQTRTQCPLISKIYSPTPQAASDSVSSGGPETDDNPYVPPDNEVRTSKYLELQKEKKRQEGLDSFVLWCSDGNDSPPLDSGGDSTRRMHAWVLVRAGMRDVEEHTFLEPTTGRAYSTGNSPYLGIESLWNKTNYWVNVNVDAAPSVLDFSLSSSSTAGTPVQWESVFLESPASRWRGTAAGRGAAKEHSREDLNPSTEDAGDDSAAMNGTEVLERTLDAPPPWCASITIDRAKYLLRYPPVGRRTVQYHKAKVDYFARNQHPQAMVMRVILYLDTARVTVSEIHEWFENRRDKLYKRVRYLLQGRFVEEFFPGSVGEVKRWEEWPGKRRDLDFYVDGRLDRMYRREEVIADKISEYFSGRPDFLTHRSMMVTLDKEKANAKNSYTLPATGLSGDLYVLRINQSFDRDPSVPSGTDIAHRIFYLTEGRVNTQYHFAEGKITQKVKSYSHAKSGGVLSGPGEDMSSEDVEGIQEAALIERECFTTVKQNYMQMLNIVKIRSEFEVDIHNDKIEKTVFEHALERAEKGATGAVGVEEDNQSDAKGVDYLTPFLRGIPDLSKITKEEALEVRQLCLDALKARLVERANIIQSRLNEENAKLARKQEQFQRSQREGDLSTEEYERYCTEAMFRIQILEQRLVAHEESAIQKFGNLDSKLSQEPRLAVLMRKE